MELIDYFSTGWGAFYSLYVIAQVVALTFVRGRLLWAALLPVAPMLWLGIETVRAYHRAAEQWGVPMAMLAPLALLYMVIVIVVSRVTRKADSRNAGRSTLI